MPDSIMAISVVLGFIGPVLVCVRAQFAYEHAPDTTAYGRIRAIYLIVWFASVGGTVVIGLLAEHRWGDFSYGSYWYVSPIIAALGLLHVITVAD